MSPLRQQILARLDSLKVELARLAALVDEATDPSSTAPLQVTEPKQLPQATEDTRARRAKAPNTWSYLPTATYRITGLNPFRAGNGGALFDHLVQTHGDAPFTRLELGDAIRRLKSTGAITSTMDEALFVIGFLRTAGAEKARVAMVSAPTPPDAPKRRRGATGA